MKRRTDLCAWLVLLVMSTMVLPAAAAVRVLPEGRLPADWRLQPPKDLNGYFPFQPPATREAWTTRAEQVRRRMLVSLGLWPMPTRTPLHAVVHGKIERDGYTVEKAYFESYPGFFVTGSLYRPRDVANASTGRRPGVLCPHGHWNQGRFYDCGLERVRKEIEQGAEKFEEGGRSPLQARCVQLARMGCTVFHYDMIGYADSVQISFELAHRFAKQRPEMNTLENWGLFSAQAEANVQSVMGLQAYNSIRALDFLAALPDVDPARLAVTGASGGGTQTMIVSAIDPRPAVAMPAVMVSTAMQGGCTCENACLLRIGTGNVEFAGLFAPKPLGLTAAKDWTREMETKGFPELQRLYALLDVPDRVMLAANLQFGHNYNSVSRAAMYGWMNRHLELGLSEPIVERDFQRLTPEEMTVWTPGGKHEKPAGGPDFERQLLRWMAEDARQQVAGLVPHDPASLGRYREVVGGAIDILIGRSLPPEADIVFEELAREDKPSYAQVLGLTRYRGKEAGIEQVEELPTVLLVPPRPSGRAVVWIDGSGKAGLFDEEDSPTPDVRELLAAGMVVIGADLLFQGEFLADGQPLTETRRVNNPRESAAYTFGYNHALIARRVQDILTLIGLAHARPEIESVDVCGLAGAGPWVALARSQAGGRVTKAAIDTGGFRFGQLLNIQAPDFLPGGAKYGDLPGIIALSAPHATWIAGETSHDLAVGRSAYQASRAVGQLSVCEEKEADVARAAVNWLIGR